MESDGTIAQAVIDGNFDPVTAAFEENEMAPPVLEWAPDPEAYRVPELALIHRYWLDLGGLHARVGPAMPEPEKLGAGLGYLMILNVEGEAPEVGYRYRLYGSAIAERSGFDLTGKRTDEVPTHPLMGRFFAWCYAAVCMRREPLFTEHNAPPLVMIANWSRVILPMAGTPNAVGDGTECSVRRLMVGNVPGPWRRPRIDQVPAVDLDRSTG